MIRFMAMTDMTDTSGFYRRLTPVRDFARLAGWDGYAPVPDDWVVGTSDIAGSSQAVAAGRYKTVNLVGAAVIAAQINAHEGMDFPFIFGGDGAGFAVPPGWAARSAEALAAVRVWAREEFAMELRIGMVPVAEIRAAGFDVKVARFQISKGADYAMFAGGGLSWAETQVKAGAYGLTQAPPGTQPDLSGLSCRWSHMRSQHGTVLSLVILPGRGVAEDAFAGFLREVVAVADRLDRSGHPARETGPGADWPPAGATLEAHAQRRGHSVGRARRKVLFESLMAWLLIRTGWKIGGFDARHYRRTVGANADFRKFDDGLKMTLDCDPATEERLRSLLEKGQRDGLARFGLYRQDEAMMTCIVPSMLTDDHFHFVDGAAGGYTEAARQIKDAP